MVAADRELRQRKASAGVPGEAAEHGCGQQRVAAEVGEGHVGRHVASRRRPSTSAHTRATSCSRGLSAVAPTGRGSLNGTSGSAARSILPLGVSGKRREHHDPCRDHVVGEALTQHGSRAAA